MPSARGSWPTQQRCIKRRPNNSTPWLPNEQQPVRAPFVCTQNLRHNLVRLSPTLRTPQSCVKSAASTPRVRLIILFSGNLSPFFSSNFAPLAEAARLAEVYMSCPHGSRQLAPVPALCELLQAPQLAPAHLT